MSGPNKAGTYRRLTGVLRVAEHSAVLEADDERVLRIITSDSLAEFDGAAVIVEGNMVGPDRLQLEWIGRAPA